MQPPRRFTLLVLLLLLSTVAAWAGPRGLRPLEDALLLVAGLLVALAAIGAGTLRFRHLRLEVARVTADNARLQGLVGERTRALREREATFAAEPPERIGDAATFIFAEGLSTGGLAADLAGPALMEEDEESARRGGQVHAATEPVGKAFSFSFPPSPLAGWAGATPASRPAGRPSRPAPPARAPR
jgi:hypothetical protein